jgi:hypothetical protein
MTATEKELLYEIFKFVRQHYPETWRDELFKIKLRVDSKTKNRRVNNE